ncbi:MULTISPECIES: hypothetical protein [Paraclostridium]|uniref:Uncharacterized protein n=1 Tax=Paraclostridium bifermentans TaxID=1490 RepID=A0A5P3X8T6_PARBF|nr:MULTISPECIES: hypothetical protein [Paraclostridium]MCU9807251.1 hypothetical protein [Paraclostridium sp. AKS46]MDV8116214.1 hypothetical protein [Bacillus sp. BAU-SS-2023]EQK41673.1 hypothetical protein C671_2654 [[Clostridium] bifermentans ATCC 19299] [Paraclostridium bifermentans ATCC 19299]MBN8047179.1 hypothetical protein [Paraclostridium bifermentans]MBZ6004693.1 hypothetical protein [Paraclostridium bifermentans]
MKSFKIRLTRDTFSFRFKQYEGTYFFGELNEETQIVKYKITKDEEGLELKEFGNTHIKEDLLYIPQVDAYIDLNSIK